MKPFVSAAHDNIIQDLPPIKSSLMVQTTSAFSACSGRSTERKPRFVMNLLGSSTHLRYFWIFLLRNLNSEIYGFIICLGIPMDLKLPSHNSIISFCSVSSPCELSNTILSKSKIAISMDNGTVEQFEMILP